MSALCQCQTLRVRNAACAVRSSISLLGALWPAQTQITFGAEDIAVKACDPLPPLRGNIQISNGGLDMWRNAVPIKLRV